MAIRIILNLPEAHGLNKPLPVSWNRKVELWRKCFNTMLRLESLKDAALKLITEANETADDRHIIFHSNWEEFTTKDGQLVATFRSSKQKGNKILSRKVVITLGQLQKMAGEIDRLNLHLLPITFALVKLQPPPTVPDKSK